MDPKIIIGIAKLESNQETLEFLGKHLHLCVCVEGRNQLGNQSFPFCDCFFFWW